MHILSRMHLKELRFHRNKYIRPVTIEKITLFLPLPLPIPVLSSSLPHTPPLSPSTRFHVKVYAQNYTCNHNAAEEDDNY